MKYTVLLITILALSSFACGQNQEFPSSTPISNKELNMTGKERQEQNAQQYQQKADQEFDAAQAQAQKAAEEQAKKGPLANPQ